MSRDVRRRGLGPLAVLVVGAGAALNLAQETRQVNPPDKPEVQLERSGSFPLTDGVGPAVRNPAGDLIERRGPTSKTFRNADGTFTTVISVGPLHYQDASGAWHDIQTAIRGNDTGRHVDHAHVVTEHPLQMYFGQTATRGYILEAEAIQIEVAGEAEVRIESAEGRVLARYSREGPPAQVAGNRIDYRHTFGSLPASERIIVRPRGLKHELVIEAPPAVDDREAHHDGRLVFAETVRLPAGGELISAPASGDWGGFLDDLGRLIAVVPAPLVYEENGAARFDSESARETTTGAIRVRRSPDGWIVETVIALEWVLAPERRYPVVIDPRIEIEPYAWGYGEGSDCLRQQTYVYCQGGSGCGRWLAWLYFNTREIPDLVDVTQMVLSVYPWDGSSTWDVSLRDMDNVEPNAACNTLTSQACNGQSYGSFSGTVSSFCRIFPGTCWHNWTLGSAAQSDLEEYLSRGQNYFGIGLRSTSSSLTNWVQIVADSVIELEPELEVTYCELLPPPVLLSPANGASCLSTSGTLDWSDVSGAAGYRVQIGTSCGSGTEYDVTSSQFPYSGLQAGTTYYWRVKTKDSCNAYGSYSNCFSFTTAPAPLPPPTLVSPPAGAACLGTSGTLDWSDVSGAAGYRVQIGTSCGSGTEYDVTSSQFPYSGLQADTTYYWRVKTRNACNMYGNYSNCLSFEVGGIPTWYRDADGDGFGNPDAPTPQCEKPAGYVDNDDDCDDNDLTTHPGASEICDNGKDDDCDALVDRDDPDCPPNCGNAVCDPGETPCNCPQDCGAPPASETNCSDGVDNDCDGLVDASDPDCAPPCGTDEDGDGFCPDDPEVAGRDCDDNDATVYPNAPERCDERDNDCNGLVDEGAPTWCQDANHDGCGDPGAAMITGCEWPVGYAACPGHCERDCCIAVVSSPEALDFGTLEPNSRKAIELNLKRASLPFTWSVDSATLPSWLRLTGHGGNSATGQGVTLFFEGNTSGLAVGGYAATVGVRVDHDVFMDLSATLRIVAAIPTVTPGSLEWELPPGYDRPAPKTVQLHRGGAPFSFEFLELERVDWLTVEPRRGVSNSGTAVNVSIQPALGLEPGQYSADLKVRFDGQDDARISASVLVVEEPPPPPCPCGEGFCDCGMSLLGAMQVTLLGLYGMKLGRRRWR